MQAKGVIRFFVYVLLIVCVYQLSFTFIANRYDKKAEQHAKEVVPALETAFGSELAERKYNDSINELRRLESSYYLDSMASQPVMNLGIIKYTLNDVQNYSLNLGLDLKGGMSVILEVAVEDVIEALADGSQDPTFNTALTNAKAALANRNDGFVQIFVDEFEKADGNAKLASIFAASSKFRDKINYNSSNDEVAKALEDEVNAIVNNTFNVIRARIDQFGVAQPEVSLDKETGRIIAELPGVTNTSRIRKILQFTAELEFWNTYENGEIINGFGEANLALRAVAVLEKENAVDAEIPMEGTQEESALDIFDDINEVTDSGEVVDDSTQNESINPLFELMSLNIDQTGQQIGQGPVVGYAYGRNINRLNEIFASNEFRQYFPSDLELLWGAKSIDADQDVFALYAIKKDGVVDGVPPLSGEAVTDARQSFDQFGAPEVTLYMDAKGASDWEGITAEAASANPKRCVAVVLDDRVYSAPRVNDKISGGVSSISGIGDIQDAVDLATILKTGKLEATARIVQEETVGPTLGAQSVKAGLLSLIAGLVFVLVFMVIYYAKAGIVSDIAVVLNLFIIFGALASIGAALTLPGMAGIVLTIGMAVDANVIIFERIREEIAKGKGVRLAIEDGFKHSYSAIIDANLTTLITAIILYAVGFGFGAVKGFAIVLIVGIISSFFTAVLVSRLLFDFAANRKMDISFATGFSKGLFKNLNINFLTKSKVAYGISGLFIVAGLASILTMGFELGTDFKGGRAYLVELDKEVTSEQIVEALKPQFEGNTVVKSYGGSNEFQIKTAFMLEQSGPDVDNELQSRLYEGLKPFVMNTDLELFKKENIKETVLVGSTMADDIRSTAIKAILLGGLLIFGYIVFRFRKVAFGVGALAAIAHDVLVILGVFSIFKAILPFSLEINNAFIAAILTVIGYSINDTVVVFDRIREYLGLHPKNSLSDNINDAINSTLSRTVMTSFTTLIVVLVLFLFGGEAIKGFSFALLVGIIVGTYSSVFIASPITAQLLKRGANSTPAKK